ncbi:TonB-dependent receptor [Bacteroides sp.]|uniref:TonB-dependent receptor n=1 Tax=Bacteroides sp. TaxID=29523 RepID=UPI002FC5B2DE
MKNSNKRLKYGHHLIFIEKTTNAVKRILLPSILLLLLFSTEAFAQKVTISLNNVTIEKVLNSISKQTKLNMAYSKEIVDVNRKVSIHADNVEVAQALDQLIANTPLAYEISNGKIYLFRKENVTTTSQKRKQITGIIIDTQGEPVIGASIIIKGTATGVITDMNGKFSLEASPNTQIEISYIGYQPQLVTIGNRNNLNITLAEDLLALEEVVVVGYGQQKKANLSGSVSQISSKELQSRPISSLSNGIQGMMPGVTITSGESRPGSDGGSIRIRGVGTLNSSDPYILIDGIESGSLNVVDPNDVESITVLKDASSAAIYGSKASNGVILITTKRGKVSKPQVSYNGNIGLQTPTALVERLNSADYATLYNQALEAENMSPQFTPQEIQKFKDGSDPFNYPNTDWKGLAFRTGVQHQHNVSVNGGTENVKYMASAGFMNQEGILPNAARTQFNARMNLDIELSKRITVRTNMSYVNNQYSDPINSASNITENSSMILRQLDAISPWVPYKKEDGSYGTVSDGNPIAWLDLDQTVDRQIQNFSGTIALDYQIIDGLKATVQGSYITQNQYNKAFMKDIQYNDNLYHGPNQLRERFYNWNRLNFDALANYEKQWGLHGFKALLGYHLEKYNYRENSIYRSGFPNNDLTDMNAGTTATQTNSGVTRELAMLSYFGRINYDYAGRYLFEANLRSDASSRFAPDKRWGYFPSFSTAWRLSEESFMENTKDWLNNLKIRGSWGLLGNQDALDSYYPWMNTYSTGTNALFDGKLVSGFAQTNYQLATITWEKARTWGLGIDVTFLDHFNVSAEYYDRLTSGIIMDVPVPSEFALGAYKDNVGKMSNKGIEITLGYDNSWKDWRLSINGNFAYNKNEILDLGGVDRMIEGSKIKQIGNAINSYYAYEAVGIFQSDEAAKAYMDQYKGKDGYPFTKEFKGGDLIYADANGDGKINSEDRIVANSTDPKFTYGFNFNLGWKNFDLSAVFNGVAGVSRLFNTQMFGEFNGTMSHPATVWLDAWSKDNLNGSMPRVAYKTSSPSSSLNTMSTFWIQNTSFLRIKNLQLGYSLPQQWLKSIGISRARVYYSGENLLTFDSLPINADPESPEGIGNYYPLVQTHSLGINLTF